MENSKRRCCPDLFSNTQFHIHVSRRLIHRKVIALTDGWGEKVAGGINLNQEYGRMLGIKNSLVLKLDF